MLGFWVVSPIFPMWGLAVLQHIAAADKWALLPAETEMPAAV